MTPAGLGLLIRVAGSQMFLGHRRQPGVGEEAGYQEDRNNPQKSPNNSGPHSFQGGSNDSKARQHQSLTPIVHAILYFHIEVQPCSNFS